MDGSLIILFALILIVGGGLLAFITMGKGGKQHLDVEKYRVKWLTIEQQVKENSESSCQLGILNADKLVDYALKERGFAGNTMGERMKSAQKVWTNANHVWTAHKLRNQIAHETAFQLNYDMTKRAMSAFRQALKDLGAV